MGETEMMGLGKGHKDEYFKEAGGYEAPAAFANMVVEPDIFDDQDGSAYIKVGDRIYDHHAIIADIMAKKRVWQKKYPKKIICGISMINRGPYGEIVSGLLIHYEVRE